MFSCWDLIYKHDVQYVKAATHGQKNSTWTHLTDNSRPDQSAIILYEDLLLRGEAVFTHTHTTGMWAFQNESLIKYNFY